MNVQTDLRLLFQKWSKSVQDKWPKVRVVLVTEKNKTCFGILRWNPCAIPPEFFVGVCIVTPDIYSMFHPRSVQVWWRH